MPRRFAAECVGTFLLVFLAVGAAVFGISGKVGAGSPPGLGNGIVGVALAFGLVLMAIAYALGPVSGAHVNPAVTLAMLTSGRMQTAEAALYWVAQFTGAIVAAALLKLFVSSFGVTDQTGGLGTNSYDNGAINLGGAFVLEVVLTAAFVLVILLVTERAAAPGFAGLAIGLALVVVHLAGIALDGTSVNPARSFGPALMNGGTSLSQVWLFSLAPLIGGVVASLGWRFLRVDPDDSVESDEIAGSERESADFESELA